MENSISSLYYLKQSIILQLIRVLNMQTGGKINLLL